LIFAKKLLFWWVSYGLISRCVISRALDGNI